MHSFTPFILFKLSKRTAAATLVALLAGAGGAALAQTPSITVASTTSTEQSGLFAHLLPAFTQATGISVKVVALGTGQAIDMGRRGDADVLFVHDQEAEEKAVAQGFAVKRYPVMYNDFVLIGPANDPAKLRGTDIVEALKKVARSGSGFISRGDKSGTHAAELRFWGMAGLADKVGDKVADKATDKPSPGYRACGCGMGPALNMAASTGAYVLADRGTWLNFKNRADLAVLVEGDRRLFNQYGVLLVNPAKHPHVKALEGQKFIDWLIQPAGQTSISSYKIGNEALFFPNANK